MAKSPPVFAPLGARARWAVALLAATLVVDVIAIASDLWQVTVIERFLDGDGDTAALTRSDDVDSLAATLQLLVFVVTAIVFLRWFSRAYRNTAALATSELRFKPGWAIGAWFVPILSFWRPKEIANEIWLASREQPAREGVPAQADDSTGLLTFWWVAWLAACVAGNHAGRSFFSADTLTDVRNGDLLDAAALAAQVVAAVVAIMIVRRATSRQMAWAQRIGARAGDAVPALPPAVA